MASSMEFEYTEFAALRKRTQSAGDTMTLISMNEGLRKIGRLFVPAKGTGPLADATPKVTGKLARSTFFQITGAPKRQVLKIMQPARTPEGDFYGEWVREGTQPHEIRPVKAKALRWFGPAGLPIFAMLVHHPGGKKNPYHQRVLAMLRPQIQQTVRKMGEQVTAFIAGRGG